MSKHSIINPRYVNNNYLQLLHKQLFNKKNVKYIVLDDFLNKDFIDNLYNEFINNITIETWKTDWKTINLVVGKYSRAFYSFCNGKTFTNILSIILWEDIFLENNIGKTNSTLLFWKLFKKLGCFIRVNSIWSELGWHTDWPIEITAWSFSLYLNRDYKKCDWGVFELWK